MNPSDKELLIEEIKVTAAQFKKKGKSLYKALEAARKENKRFEECGVGLPDEEVVAAVQKAFDKKWFLNEGIVEKTEMENITWAVKDVLLNGCLNLFVGDPDIGKSFMAIHYIAQLTREGKKCIAICKEDSYGNVWKPRLRAAGADLNLVITVNHMGDMDDPTFKEDWALDNLTHRECLKQLILKHDAALTVIDPLDSFSGGKDLLRRKDVRDLMDPLNEIAQSTKKAILINCHTTKAIVDSVIKCAAGSFQLMAAVQIAWFLMGDPDKEDVSLFMCARNKFGGKTIGQRYTIKSFSETDDTGVIEFKGAEYRSVNGMLKQLTSRLPEDSKAAKCRKWLRQLLDGGPQPSEVCIKAAQAFGFDKNTINAACANLKVLRDGNTWRIEPKEEATQSDIFDGVQSCLKS